MYIFSTTLSVYIQTLQTRLYDKDSEDWKWIASDIDFRRPDYEPLEGIVAFRLSLPEWQKSFRQDRQRICAKELYTEVRDEHR